MSQSIGRGLRGSLVYFIADPFEHDIAACFRYEQDGVVIMTDGKISAVGPADVLLPTLAPEIELDEYPDGLIMPGFIDGHIHYAQTDMVGAYGKELLDWLTTYTFVEEQKFKDADHAKRVADFFCDQLLSNGTTTALVFGTVYPQSVDALFQAASERNMRLIAGKVLMDRNAPDALLDTPVSAYEDTKRLIETWHDKGRNLYAITPRFAPTSSPEELQVAGKLWAEYPSTYMHTHLSENESEVSWVQSLFPDSENYLDVYARNGLTGRRSVYAHAIHVTDAELQHAHDTGSAFVHCPTSNLFLGSGLFPLARAKDTARPVRVAMGTDIGAGTSFSMLQTLNEAYKVSQLRHEPLDAFKAFYLATLGGAKALYLDDRLGSLETGKEADVIVLDAKATPLLERRLGMARTIEEVLFVLMTLGDDRAVAATYVAGQPVHVRR